MKPGIRLQLMLALASLIVLAFVPLFIAIASLTQATLQGVRDASARALGRAVASHVAEARRTRSAENLQSLLDAEIGAAGLHAIGVYSQEGHLASQAGDPAGAVLPKQIPVDAERTRTVHTDKGRALEVIIPGPDGSVVAILRTDDESARARPVVRLAGLYMASFALALVVFTYIFITRLIVRPIDELSDAARRVAQGARTLDAPSTRARELAELGASVADMTRQLRAEEENLRTKVEALERTTHELKNAQQTLVRSERLASVGKLAAGLAHEIGNPIAAILGFEDLLLAGDLEPGEQKDFLERMKRETERIHRVLRQLLDFARPATARPLEKDEPGSVLAAIDDVTALLRPHKSMREVALRVHAADDVPCVGLSRNQIEQVLLNILLNAADAVGAGGEIDVRVQLVAGRVLVSVQDNGPGVCASIRQTIFEPFATTKDVGAGTGLGLAICRGIVEAAGGSIGFEDAPGGGTVFYVALPVAESSSADSDVASGDRK